MTIITLTSLVVYQIYKVAKFPKKASFNESNYGFEVLNSKNLEHLDQPIVHA